MSAVMTAFRFAFALGLVALLDVVVFAQVPEDPVELVRSLRHGNIMSSQWMEGVEAIQERQALFWPIIAEELRLPLEWPAPWEDYSRVGVGLALIHHVPDSDYGQVLRKTFREVSAYLEDALCQKADLYLLDVSQWDDARHETRRRLAKAAFQLSMLRQGMIALATHLKSQCLVPEILPRFESENWVFQASMLDYFAAACVGRPDVLEKLVAIRSGLGPELLSERQELIFDRVIDQLRGSEGREDR